MCATTAGLQSGPWVFCDKNRMGDFLTLFFLLFTVSQSISLLSLPYSSLSLTHSITPFHRTRLLLPSPSSHHCQRQPSSSPTTLSTRPIPLWHIHSCSIRSSCIPLPPNVMSTRTTVSFTLTRTYSLSFTMCPTYRQPTNIQSIIQQLLLTCAQLDLSRYCPETLIKKWHTEPQSPLSFIPLLYPPTSTPTYYFLTPVPPHQTRPQQT